MANAYSVACAANKDKRCSSAISAVSPNVAPSPPLLGNNAHRQEPSLPTLQRNPPTLGNILPRPTPTPPTPQHSAKAFTCTAAACQRGSFMSTTCIQQFCLYCKHARAALCCCCRKVWRASWMWRRRRQRHRKMVWAAAIHRARAVFLHVALHGGNNNKVLCASARHFNVALHNGDNTKNVAERAPLRARAYP
jgi:hypothetical protein